MKKKGMLEEITAISLAHQVWNQSVVFETQVWNLSTVFVKKLKSILQQMDQKEQKLCSTLLVRNL